MELTCNEYMTIKRWFQDPSLFESNMISHIELLCRAIKHGDITVNMAMKLLNKEK